MLVIRDNADQLAEEMIQEMDGNLTTHPTKTLTLLPSLLHFLATYPLQTSSQHTSQHTLINPPYYTHYQYTLSTYPTNTPSQHTLSIYRRTTHQQSHSCHTAKMAAEASGGGGADEDTEEGDNAYDS